ncbi:peptidase family protein [Halobacteroides halobius DSM 5150]|uniref:Peptidase family protein n=1 Tax=Halobacteroides halobius (strain ATCC 35273 / DSM 5150 / MD-1) TaxID=748449 RepID=L0KAE6_HALHC|nr:M42 family metallopeptidase [Halobacteroides halobius]AGB41319.1 peptidase family protein [Halobacteroides halobius DSM 5150]
MENKQKLSELSEAIGVSGYEAKLAKQVGDLFIDYVDEIKYDALGNLISCKEGAGTNNLKIMLAAHIDEIGLMITDIEDEGFLRFTPVGGVDQRTLVGQEVLVHGEEKYHGIIGAKPPHVQEADERKKAYKMKDLYIDLGLAADKVKKEINVGDIVSFVREFKKLENDRVSGKSIDDRAGVLVLLHTLQELKKLRHQADFYAVATVQEEVGVRGATTSTYGVVPDIGVAVDVSHGIMPGVSDENASELGEGPAVGFGPHVHPQLFNKFEEIAKDLEIPYQVDPSNTPAGTDAYAIQVTRSGIPTALITIPLRYMHTSVETISFKDVKRAGRLLAHFIAEIDADFVEGLKCF